MLCITIVLQWDTVGYPSPCQGVVIILGFSMPTLAVLFEISWLKVFSTRSQRFPKGISISMMLHLCLKSVCHRRRDKGGTSVYRKCIWWSCAKVQWDRVLWDKNCGTWCLCTISFAAYQKYVLKCTQVAIHPWSAGLFIHTINIHFRQGSEFFIVLVV